VGVIVGGDSVQQVVVLLRAGARKTDLLAETALATAGVRVRSTLLRLNRRHSCLKRGGLLHIAAIHRQISDGCRIDDPSSGGGRLTGDDDVTLRISAALYVTLGFNAAGGENP